jgi:CDGSH-type Zn-finger protein/uncharacterized Fe-S cluster protein YjdI
VKSKIHHYIGIDIDVSYDVVRCIHAEECIKRLSAVFDAKRRPWIMPDEASADQLAETILNCPSGALHYTRQDGEHEITEAVNTVRLAENGPLYVRGQFRITASTGEVLLEDTRAALCRCGASQNKPLCDNSHKTVGFRAAATRETISALPNSVGEALEIEPAPDGPLHVTGHFAILGAEDEVLFQGEEAWLCRCGGSSDKPFCDSTHKRIGFQAE